jgi:hypothetical protein
MFMRAIFCAAIPFALVAALAIARDDQSKTEKPPKEKLVCQKHVVVGSHIPQTECHTAKEWEQIAQDNKENVRGFSDSLDNNNVQPKAGLGGGG